MKVTRFLVAIGIAALVAWSAAAQGGRGRQMQNCPYDVSSEVVVKGVVERVDQHTGKRGMTGIHITLSTDGGSVVVYLGPSWYLDDQHFAVVSGDTIEVAGSRATVSGTEVVLARSIVNGGTTITLRDEHGFPMWSRQAGSRKSA